MEYEFNIDDVFRFASFVGRRVFNKGNEIVFDVCPLCRGGGGKDKKTFSINSSTGQCECKRSSCSYRGNMITLARDTGFELSDQVVRHYNIGGRNNKFKTFRNQHIEVTDKAISYLQKRGISKAVVERYEITTWPNKDSVLVFPFKDEKGELCFAKYRDTEFTKESSGNKEWCESNCKPILFGMYQCNLENKTLIVTEGQIDSLSVTEAGFENAVSVPTGKNGFTWVGHCWEWIHNFEEIVVFGDLENGQITLLDEFRRKFRSLTVKNVRPEDYKGCKDANELLQLHGKDAIVNAINNAALPPVNHIAEISKIAEVNLYDMEKLKTGFYDLDRMLYGGIPFGGICLMTGKAGEGKSTLASQLLIQAMAQGYKFFAYSGELPKSSFKNWISFQLAGPSGIEIYRNNQTDIDRYRITELNQKKLDEWLEGKGFVYDYDLLNEGDERENLIETCELMINRYGVRVLLIDNLMTALDITRVQSTDKYDKQSLFVKALVRLALKYNVLIILVAHKRKNTSENESDDISGSSDIGNLAQLTISYGRNGKDKTHFVKILKNRWFGATNTEGWATMYDQQSRRIYIRPNELYTDFGWFYEDDPTEGFAEAEDLPFLKEGSNE